MRGNFAPHAYDGLITFLINLLAKANLYKTTLVITTGHITIITNDLAALQYDQACSQNIKDTTQSVNDHKRNLVFGPGPIGAFIAAPIFGTAPTAVAANILARVYDFAAFCKAATAYTTAIGEDMGIEGPILGAGPSKPEGTLGTALPDSVVRLDWVKSVFSGVRIESQRAGETTWTFIGVDTVSPFLDNRPPLVAGQAEVRRYRLRYILNDEPVGDWSDIVTVSTTP